MPTNDALRSKEMSEKYRAHRATGVLERSCPLCDAGAIKVFKLWKIIPNNFPYDLIAEIHHMIIPLRHVGEEGLTNEEWTELYDIKKTTMQEYDMIVEGTHRTKSVPAHFHLHLINTK